MVTRFQALDCWILQVQYVASIWFPHDEIANYVGLCFSLRALHSPARVRGGVITASVATNDLRSDFGCFFVILILFLT